MGKKDFKSLYRSIKAELGEVTCKISYYSDNFDPNKNYAGVIIYAVDEKFQWFNNEGLAKGHRGKSFYIIVKCTDDFPPHEIREAANGRVHHYPLKQILGSYENVCCGGFAYKERKLKFSSIWYNKTSQKGCESDGNKELSEPEIILVKYCFEQYKSLGKHKIFKIPENIDRQLS